MSYLFDLIQHHLALSAVIFLCVLLCLFFVALKVISLSQKLKRIGGSSAKMQVKLKLFELCATQLLRFETQLGQVIYHHKTVLANKLDNASKSFLEDVNAAIELNNTKKEKQLKSELIALVQQTKQAVANDVLNTQLAVKQLELFASVEMLDSITVIHQRLNEMFQQTDNYLTHLLQLADDPFDSRLQHKLSLSNNDKDELMALIEQVNEQFKNEKQQLLA